MNKVQIDGRLTHDPEIQYTKNGKIYAKFSLAHHIKQRGEDGVMYVDCLAFGDTAEKIGNELTKGKFVNISDSTLRIEKSKDGTKKYTTLTVWGYNIPSSDREE